MPRILTLLLAVVALEGVASARAQCSRPVTVAYTTPQVLQAFSARPALGLPSFHEALATESGCTIQLHRYPTARIWRDYFAGELDIAFGAVQSAERDAIGVFIPTTQQTWMLVTTRPLGSVPERLEQFAAQRGLLVGILHGGFYSTDVAAVLESLRKQGQIDEYSDPGNGIDKLLANRDAALIISSGSLEYVLPPKKLQKLNLRLIPQPQFNSFSSGIYLNRKSLNETDRGVLIRAIYAPAIAAISDKLRQQRARELADEAEEEGVHKDPETTLH